MKRLIRSTLIAGLLFVLGCSTIRMRYEAQIETKSGEEADVIYERSYPITGHMIGCLVTGIIYGGWCWTYVLMPFGSQKYEVERDAEAYMRSKAGKSFDITYEQSKKAGYFDAPVEKSYDVQGKASNEDENSDESTAPSDSRKKQNNRTSSRGRDQDARRREEIITELKQFERGAFKHYLAAELHLGGIGATYGASVGGNRHINVSAFSSRPTTLFSSGDAISIHDIDMTLKFHSHNFYLKFGGGYRIVNFHGGPNDFVDFKQYDVRANGSVTTLGGVAAIGVDIADGNFFYGAELLRWYKPVTTVSESITFHETDGTPAAAREDFITAAATRDSGDFLKFRFGIVIR